MDGDEVLQQGLGQAARRGGPGPGHPHAQKFTESDTIYLEAAQARELSRRNAEFAKQTAAGDAFHHFSLDFSSLLFLNSSDNRLASSLALLSTIYHFISYVSLRTTSARE